MRDILQFFIVLVLFAKSSRYCHCSRSPFPSSFSQCFQIAFGRGRVFAFNDVPSRRFAPRFVFFFQTHGCLRWNTYRGLFTGWGISMSGVDKIEPRNLSSNQAFFFSIFTGRNRRENRSLRRAFEEDKGKKILVPT